MTPRRGGAAGAGTPTTPVTGKKATGTSHDRPQTVCRPVSASRVRRDTLCSALLWVAAGLVILGLLTIYDRPVLTVLAWGAAFVLVTCEEVVP